MVTLAVWTAQSASLTAISALFVDDDVALSDAESVVMLALADEAAELAALPFDADDYPIRSEALHRLQGMARAITQRQDLTDLQMRGFSADLGIAKFDIFERFLLLSP